MLDRSNRGSLVEIERKILIENHRDIARAGFHLRGCPGRQSRLNRSAGFLQLRHDLVVALYFTKPRRAFLEPRR